MQAYLDNPGNFSHDQTRITMVWNVLAGVLESPSDLDVRQFMIGNGSGGVAPVTYTPAGSPVAWPIRGYSQHEEAPGIWKVSVSYSCLSYQFSFDLNGSDQTIYQAKETLHTYSADGGQAPDLKEAINVDDNGVHGCSIFVPNCSWSETLEVPVTGVTGTYKQAVYGLIGHTNGAAFRGLPAYSVLFKGCTGSVSMSNPLFFSLTFKFAYEPNRTDISVGKMKNIVKNGWDYLWVKYKKTQDMQAQPPRTTEIPENVYVVRVYDSGDFSKLNIGTGDGILWGGK